MNPFKNAHQQTAWLYGLIAAYAGRVSELEIENQRLRLKAHNSQRPAKPEDDPECDES